MRGARAEKPCALNIARRREGRRRRACIHRGTRRGREQRGLPAAPRLSWLMASRLRSLRFQKGVDVANVLLVVFQAGTDGAVDDLPVGVIVVVHENVA